MGARVLPLTVSDVNTLDGAARVLRRLQSDTRTHDDAIRANAYIAAILRTDLETRVPAGLTRRTQ